MHPALPTLPALVLAAAVATGPAGAPAPSAMREVVVARGFDSPVSMAFAPDGRVFVCEQAGRVRVVKRGRLLDRPLLTVPARASLEDGLLGVACDPDFARNGWVYVCWTDSVPRPREVIERYTVRGDRVVSGSAKRLVELDPRTNRVHVGGTLRVGPDGRLWVGTGDDDRGEAAQSLRSTAGKLLRFERDGSVPADNPFVRLAHGVYGAIWARGFRNPFAFDFDPASGRPWVNDVGGSLFEEVNDVAAGANLGWPIFEGRGTDARFRDPAHAYTHALGCAITGGAFVPVAGSVYPREWAGRWVFADLCASELRWLDPAAPDSATAFLRTTIAGPVDLRAGPDGCLWYLARGNSGATGGPGSARGALVRLAPRWTPRGNASASRDN
ncbi:MAG: PQQ-dependent sugar dehydrogenase [Candidatus Eisenbacteria bacterium]|uniref:PQQ-dependent sugar dehydrogenase n=1 Tax=Eiseniibacteriota bacterium TaxID=2212470 RepID=A0A933SEI2_UNCEI|nr:PQQ-dependent sugar dehydrogenase [Candidatus Eisenbacteria bacterium]